MRESARPLVVVGAGAAGLGVAEALRVEGWAGRIVLVGDEGHLPYDRPPLSKGYLTGAIDRSRLALRDRAVLDRLDLDLRLGTAATGLDRTARELHLHDGSVLGYDKLVVATGVRPRMPDDLARAGSVRVLRTLDDADRLATDLRSANSLLVIGGGLLGYELAALGGARGVQVTLVDRRPRPLAGVLGTTAGDLLADLHSSHGVAVRSGRSVRDVASTGNGPARVTLDDGSRLTADVVVAAVGSVPNVEWLAGTGFDLADGVGCDVTGRAGPGVYAVGDVARWGNGGARVEHRTNATEQALAVAQHVVHDTVAATAAPYFWTDQYGERIQVAGVVASASTPAVVAGDLAERRFVLAWADHGVVRGVLGWRMPKEFARHRRSLAQS